MLNYSMCCDYFLTETLLELINCNCDGKLNMESGCRDVLFTGKVSRQHVAMRHTCISSYSILGKCPFSQLSVSLILEVLLNLLFDKRIFDLSKNCLVSPKNVVAFSMAIGNEEPRVFSQTLVHGNSKIEMRQKQQRTKVRTEE